MARTRPNARPIKFTLRLYPGQDEDLICWLAGLDEEKIGTKTRAVKEMLRNGLAGEQSGGPVHEGVIAPALDLAAVRRVVEAAVDSSLERLAWPRPGEGQGLGRDWPPTSEPDDEVEDLLDTLEQALVLEEE